jgi:protein phosphatase
MAVETTMSTRTQGPPQRRPGTSSLTPALFTTRGCRDTNQDRVCALRTVVAGEPAVLLAVADGIGGLPAGGHAAELALQVVSHFAHYVIPETEAGPSLRGTLAELLRAAGRRIWLWARDQGLGGAAGSTLVCALVWGRHFLVAHAGDSRCYRVDARGASRLTRDHSEAGRLANALGWPTDLVIELTPADGDPGVLDEDGVLLVCSDGLHGVVAESDFHSALLETRTAEDACRRLVSLALDRGSTDNVSVAAVEVGRLSRRSRSA